MVSSIRHADFLQQGGDFPAVWCRIGIQVNHDSLSPLSKLRTFTPIDVL
jgi:hypothetical protein